MSFFHSKNFSSYSIRRGFTLIELLVVVAIIGLLSSIVLTSLNGARVKARDAKRMEDLRQIRIAIELFYDDNNYYPSAGCWDCNNYRYSNTGSWDSLAADLAPYIKSLPEDPVNTSGCGPWQTNCFTYSYGNVGRTTYSPQYDLTTQLEDQNSPYRCAVKQYRYYFNGSDPWCGNYSGQIYEA